MANAPAVPDRADPARGEALRVVDVTKSFRSGFARRRLRGIDGVSFTVERGSLFALLGHNGAGKTTTINCILDLVHPDRGTVNILGRAHADREVRGHVGYLPERPYFFEHLTGSELLRFYAKLQGVPVGKRAAEVDRVVARLGIESYRGKRLKKYSKGMLQRIGIAQALLGDPELLILDEPMSGLDPIGRREIRELLLELKQAGKTIILSSHIVPDVEQLADTVAILREGKLAVHCSLEELGVQPSFEIHAEGAGVKTAADAGELGRALELCRREGRAVRRIVTRSSGLEELYLRTHDHTEGVR